MTDEKLNNKLDQAEGFIKENAGKLLDDKKLESEGKVENLKAKIKDGIEDAKDVVEGTIDGLKDKE